jgi:Zn-dependent protease
MDFMQIAVYIVVLVFSVMIHEVAHGLVASWRGDDTARLLGRITLNPIAHIDIFGSIILPALMLLSHSGFLFAWAKPVPINYSRLKNAKSDIPLTALAGPVANILLAVIASVIIRIVVWAGLDAPYSLGENIVVFMLAMISVNLCLAIFNLIPIPPLDGSKIITYFMPTRMTISFLNLNSMACFIVLLVLLWTGVLGKILGPLIQTGIALLLWGL